MDPRPDNTGAAEVIQSTLSIARLGLRARFTRAGRRIYWIAAPFILASAVLSGSAAPVLAALAMALCALAMLVGTVAGSATPPSGVLATLDGRGLSVGTPTGVVALRRDGLRDGMVIARYGRFALRLHDRAGDRYELAMPDEPTAWRWLDALGLGADRRAVRVVSDRMVIQAVAGYFLSSFGALPVMLAWMFILNLIGGRGADVPAQPLSSFHAAMFGAWAMSWLVGHVDVTVGGDGLRVSRGVRRRFVPFGALSGVTRPNPNEVALHLHGEWRPLSLRFSSDVDAEAVVVRINAARATWEAAAPPSFLARLAVAYPGDAQAWRAALREAVSDSSYRTTALTTADLEAVVASVAVTSAQRTGAALALSDLQSGTERTGVRVATELLVGAEAVEPVARTGTGRSGARGSR